MNSLLSDADENQRPEGWNEEFPAFAENLRDDSGKVIANRSLAKQSPYKIVRMLLNFGHKPEFRRKAVDNDRKATQTWKSN